MKRFLMALAILVGLISCENVERRDFALQAKINNKFYSSNDARATKNEDGSVTIQGFNTDETMTLHISNAAKSSYEIREGGANYAMFEDLGGNLYTTRPNGKGIIVVSSLDEENNTISGTFKYDAYLPGIDTIFVEKGVFFQIPFSEEGVIDPTNAGIFGAKLNGNPFSPIMVAARDTGNSIVVTASTTNYTITISLPIGVEVSENTLPQSGFTAKYQDDNGSETANSGEIKVLEHNVAGKTIKVSFSFFTNQNEITEGNFEVVYE